MLDVSARLLSVEHFVAFEGEPDKRYQLVRGVVQAMAPAQVDHGRLVSRLSRFLGNQLKPSSEPVSEVGIKPAGREDTYWQADLAVQCAPTLPGEVYLLEPRLIIEVLSPSTAAIDRTLKLDDYRAMASVQDILLVATEDCWIEHWQRQRGLWEVRGLGPGETVEIADLGVAVALDELYADMLPEPGAAGSS